MNSYNNSKILIDEKEKLVQLFDFLKRNREFNMMVHEFEYKKALMPNYSIKENVISLLYYAVYTQSQPKLDSLFHFFKAIQKVGKFDSFKVFLNALNKIEKKSNWTNPIDESTNYNGLFHSLKNKEGWGEKTAALFAKAVFKIHNHYDLKFGFWYDLEKGLKEDDKLYLPVDEVILTIFNTMYPNLKWNFKSINELIHANWKGEELEIWDDLWFWGFITQKTNKTGRIMEYNEAKLWSLQAIPKESYYLEKLEDLTKEFIKIIEN
jgi:hypothetical protein